jgi:hypothetical protein
MGIEVGKYPHQQDLVSRIYVQAGSAGVAEGIGPTASALSSLCRMRPECSVRRSVPQNPTDLAGLRPASAGMRRGRPWHDSRSVLNGVLWVLGIGALWRELAEKYPPYQTCHRRFQQWIRDGKLVEALRLLARLLHRQGKLNLDEAFVDAIFASAKMGLCSRPHPPR